MASYFVEVCAGPHPYRRKMQIAEMERIAEREHLRIIPEKEYQEFLAWKEKHRKR